MIEKQIGLLGLAQFGSHFCQGREVLNDMRVTNEHVVKDTYVSIYNVHANSNTT